MAISSGSQVGSQVTIFNSLFSAKWCRGSFSETVRQAQAGQALVSSFFLQIHGPRLCSSQVSGGRTSEIHLVEVKYCEDTWPGHQLEASRKQQEVLCKHWGPRTLSFTLFFLV